MKRSPMPRRRTPLRSIKPLRRAAIIGKRQHQRAEYTHLRALVHAREGGNCARCGTHTPITVGECHHRLLRSRGGKDDAWTCVWLCHDCHGWAHRNVAEATVAGWIVPSSADPSAWPVHREHHGRTGWFQPGPDGWAEAVPDERQVAA